MAVAARLNRLWRAFGVSFAFALFGIGGLALGFLVMPLIRLTTLDPDSLRRRTQRFVHHCFRGYIALWQWMGLFSAELHHLERLRTPAGPQGRLVIANHPSLVDVVLLVSLLPEVDCIVKRSLWRNPFLRWPVLWARYIPNDEGETLVRACVERLRAGRTLLVFPEGTRTRPGEPLRMQRGAAQIALAAGCEILPVQVQCQPEFLSKRQWPWQAPMTTPHFRISIAPALTAHARPQPGEPVSLAARRLTREFMAWYAESSGAPPL
ncbi:MAG: lysophospholipid acyltransferase family protein [Pseudomonadota bacterium]